MDPVAMTFVSLVGFLGIGLLFVRVVLPIARALRGPISLGYVTLEQDRNALDRVSAHRKAEMEILPERENGGKLTTAQLDILVQSERQQATARALGTLIGAGLIVPEGHTKAMTALFGPPGRSHSKVRPWVDDAEAQARRVTPQAPDPEAELLIVRDHAGERLIVK